jgi:hypothetical protein
MGASAIVTGVSLVGTFPVWGFWAANDPVRNKRVKVIYVLLIAAWFVAVMVAATLLTSCPSSNWICGHA